MPVIPDAPHVMDPVDMPDDMPDISAALSSPTGSGGDDDEKGSFRSWYKHLYDMHDLDKMAESALYLKDILETQGPFDVCTLPRVDLTL